MRVYMVDNETNAEVARFLKNDPVNGVYLWGISCVCIGMASGLLVALASLFINREPNPLLLGIFVIALITLSMIVYLYGSNRKAPWATKGQ